MTDQERTYYMTRRQTLIMELGALEDLLGMERSIVPKRKRAYADTGYGATLADTIAMSPTSETVAG